VVQQGAKEHAAGAAKSIVAILVGIAKNLPTPIATKFGAFSVPISEVFSLALLDWGAPYHGSRPD